MRKLAVLLTVVSVVLASLVLAERLAPDPPEFDIELAQVLTAADLLSFDPPGFDPNSYTSLSSLGDELALGQNALLVTALGTTTIPNNGTVNPNSGPVFPNSPDPPIGNSLDSHNALAEWTNLWALFYSVSEVDGDWAVSQFFVRTPSGYDRGGVSLDGDRAAVGTYGAAPLGGQVAVFVRTNGTWTEEQVLQAGSTASEADFGRAVQLRGDRLIVGARGTAYVFTREESGWVETGELSPAGTDTDPEFGRSVAIDGDVALIGGDEAAYFFASSRSASARGRFLVPGTGWQQLARLETCSDVAGGGYGRSVALDGGFALVGAPVSSTEPGYVCAYSRRGSRWAAVAELRAADGVPGDGFGSALSLRGIAALVGASKYPNPASQGSAYIFTRSGGIWTERARLDAGELPAGQFGAAVSLFANTALVGAPSTHLVSRPNDPIFPTDPNVPDGAAFLFRVVIPTEDLLRSLVFDVRSLGVSTRAQAELVSGLTAALMALTDEVDANDGAALDHVREFEQLVEAHRGRALTDVDADALSSAARRIRARLSR